MEITTVLPIAAQKLPRYSEGHLKIFAVFYNFYLLHDGMSCGILGLQVNVVGKYLSIYTGYGLNQDLPNASHKHCTWCIQVL